MDLRRGCESSNFRTGSARYGSLLLPALPMCSTYDPSGSGHGGIQTSKVVSISGPTYLAERSSLKRLSGHTYDFKEM